MQLNTKLDSSSPAADAVVRSQQESLSRLLNTYLRENGQHFPGYSSPLRPELTLKVVLPQLQKTLYGSLRHHSAGGHHVFGDSFFTEEHAHAEEVGFETIVNLLLDEVSFAEKDPESRELKKLELQTLLLNSTRRMEGYFRHASQQPLPALDFRSCEQSLLSGHPFHPTPKSLEGFSETDSRVYSPEYGTAFSLYGFAVAQDCVVEDWLMDSFSEADANWIPEPMKAAARSKLSDEYADYVILPCHPWQANYLLSLESVQQLIHNKQLIDLGLTGPTVYPTSSVRTVWSPEQQCFFKLSLHIRITNFIRENNYEQLRRTLDAAKVVHAVRERYTTEQFQLLLEEGYRTVGIPGVSSLNEDLLASFSMIVREAPKACSSSDQPPYVLASLLEVLPGEEEPLLFRAVRESLPEGGPDPDWIAWLQRYLQLSMLPILRLYTETGISLEAHVQNAMLSLDKGTPAVFYVRDLEGISVNEEIARRENWMQHLIEEDSPVLYSEAESRHRLKYYFFVNHLCHLIQRLAFHSGQAEQPFWHTVKLTLEQMKQESDRSTMQNLLDDLLNSDYLPAKANLLSRFHKRGETPLYVNIPNPIKSC
ncbi:IucA/IucC family protein [Paenibacillus radicis (ex Gao et al. 2016)]|uniref:Siderophore biosynthesis protein SbnE n=1 Tax=Paenibacillus radicis (ex Gao et al. 2016) TaxID=1737354 RepID=A0A917H6L6_9BACL|nr:IucA/IucC family protein [Paenibacillus radicis (ex Gao et al. 2016)]GGG68248.1 siderophore biosynthesis protein SbnE [Paenibacillus radicis (ex Gao et al. 2016)]